MTKAELKAAIIDATMQKTASRFSLTGDRVKGNFWTGFTIESVATTAGSPTGLAPVITSALEVSVQNGDAFSYTITADNSPTSFDATGLPSWASINTATGVISGTPNNFENDTVTISATNASGTDTKTLKIHVIGPRITVYGFSLIAIGYPDGDYSDGTGWANCTAKVVTAGYYVGATRVTTLGPTPALEPADIPYYEGGVLKVDWSL